MGLINREVFLFIVFAFTLTYFYFLGGFDYGSGVLRDT